MLLETELAGLLTKVDVQEVVVGKVLRDVPEGLGRSVSMDEVHSVVGGWDSASILK